jgi:hypothetical protein
METPNKHPERITSDTAFRIFILFILSPIKILHKGRLFVEKNKQTR